MWHTFCEPPEGKIWRRQEQFQRSIPFVNSPTINLEEEGTIPFQRREPPYDKCTLEQKEPAPL